MPRNKALYRIQHNYYYYHYCCLKKENINVVLEKEEV